MAHFLKFIFDQDAVNGNSTILQVLRGIMKNENNLRDEVKRFIIYLTSKKFKPSKSSI